MEKRLEYIDYERSESGTLTRTHADVSLRSEVRRDSYPWREKLTGWPERSVFLGAAVRPFRRRGPCIAPRRAGFDGAAAMSAHLNGPIDDPASWAPHIGDAEAVR